MADATINTVESIFHQLWDKERARVLASGNMGLVELMDLVDEARMQHGAAPAELMACFPSLAIAGAPTIGGAQ